MSQKRLQDMGRSTDLPAGFGLCIFFSLRSNPQESEKKSWFSGFVLNLLSLLRHRNFMKSSEDKALQGRMASANTELQVRGDKTLN